MKKKIQLLVLSLFTCNILLAQTPSMTITGGGDHSLVLCNGSPISFGQNSVGQLGDGTTNNSSTPIQINTLSGISAVAAGGGSKSLFLKNDSSVWACGDNSYGQLGDGTLIDKQTPVQLNTLSAITAIAGQDFHSLFLKDDGTVWATGQNVAGALGIGTNINSSTPTLIGTLNNVVAIAAGQSHSLFLKNDGTVWACGGNLYGELGDGTTNQSLIPIQVINLSGIVAIAAGKEHSLFLRNDGTVWGCGYNGAGQLGDGTLISTSIPIQIPNFNNIEFIATGDLHSVFLKSDKTVWACGDNSFGQLGDGSTVDKLTPIQILTLDSVKGISSGEGHSLFLKENNTYWACGWNASGQLGDGTTTNRTTPVQILYSCTPTCIAPTLPIITGNTTVCNGFSTILTASATGTDSNTNYNWTGPSNFSSSSETISNISESGLYTCIISNGNGCSATISRNIVVYPLPTPVIIQNGNDITCQSFSTYQWFVDSMLIPLANNQIYTPLTSGNYTVEVVDSNGCTNISSGYYVTITGYINVNSATSINVFPNPFGDIFTLQILTPKQENVSLTLYNISGEVIKENSILSNTKMEFINSDFPCGMYFLKISLANGETRSIKVVRQ
jgi:alpha-tubulin suppressor-like RCC1 family protein